MLVIDRARMFLAFSFLENSLEGPSHLHVYVLPWRLMPLRVLGITAVPKSLEREITLVQQCGHLSPAGKENECGVRSELLD